MATPSCPVAVVSVFLPGLGEVIVKDRQGHITEERREDTALGSAGDRVPLDAVFRDDTAFEERLDQAQDALVPDPGPQPVHETDMRDFVEARFDVSLDDPLIRALSKVLDLGDGVMRPTFRAETVA